MEERKKKRQGKILSDPENSLMEIGGDDKLNTLQTEFKLSRLYIPLFGDLSNRDIEYNVELRGIQLGWYC